MVSVTATVTEPLAPPAANIWTLPEYVPALRPAGDIDKEIADGATPDVGDTVSQDSLVLALQLSVPPPPFVIWMDCAEGVVPPTVKAYCRLVGATATVETGAAVMMLMESHADDDSST